MRVAGAPAQIPFGNKEGFVYSLWLFYLHSAVKIRPFYPVFPLAGATAKVFFRLSFWNFKKKTSTIFYNTAIRKGCVPGIAILVM